MLFWILAGAMLALALALTVPNLLRGSPPPVNAAAADARRRLQSLEAAFADGHVEAADYAARKATIAQTLLDAVDEPAAPARAPWTALAITVLTPALALILYWQVGTPRALGLVATSPTPAAANPAQGETAPELADAMTQLAARLANNPEDVDGWFLLGRTYRTMSRFAEARDAYGRALELAPRTPPIMVELAEAIAFASGEATLPAEAKQLLNDAIALDPNSQKGLWMLGLDALNSGDAEQALALWQPLLAQLEPGSGAAGQVAEQIRLAEQQLGRAPSGPLAQASAIAPAADGDPPATSGAALTVAIRLSPALRERVNPADTLFVFARAHNGPPMPLAIARLNARDLPATVRLDSSMAMMPAMSLDKFPQVIVGARISKSGNASPQPGDMEALSAPVSNVRQELIELEIATIL